MNYYRCENPDCGFLAEEGNRMSAPVRGHLFLSVDEEGLTGPGLGVRATGPWMRSGRRTALACYQQAAALDDMLGVTNLGWCLRGGIGVPADPRQAVVLYVPGRRPGLYARPDEPGILLPWDRCGADDPPKAVRSSERGRKTAQGPSSRGGGIFPRPGSGAERRGGRPLVSVRRVAGLSRGVDRTGRCLEFGTGRPRVSEQAVIGFPVAAENGNAPGQCCLGFLW